MITTLLMGVIVGLVGGFFLRTLYAHMQGKSLEMEIRKITLTAKEEAQKIIEKAENKAEEFHKEIKEKEDRLAKKDTLLDQRALELDKERDKFEKTKTDIEGLKKEAQNLVEKSTRELERVSGLTLETAKEELVRTLEREHSEDLLVRLHKLEEYNREHYEQKAKDLLVTAMHRMSASVVQEVTTTSVAIPSDDVKGKIIGKEGRNVRAFEQASGVEVIIDDTPGMITLSSFDPIRRQVARVALENLIIDGRIQPAKIEEFVKKAQDDINKIMKEKGEWAVHEVGVYNLDPRIIAILGRLWFRYSYGQNVLQHSVEMAHIAGMLAHEIGADVMVAKAGALVHDIGKALDHEIQGTHIEIGIRILQKFGADERVILAMRAHHDDYPHETPEAVIVTVSDHISGGRPGARRDNVENYIKRLQELERVATSFDGIEKAYALSAGREIRIFVTPQEVNDLEAHRIAREVARKIEAELKYPGEIKVTVIRENRVIEYAR